MTVNAYSGLLALQQVLSLSTGQEKRMINNASGQILYLGLTLTPNASTADPVWMVLAFAYDSNGFLNYQQLPVNGEGYLYVWDDVASYF